MTEYTETKYTAEEPKTTEDAEFSYEDTPRPSAFLQWKNIDACFDFYCRCGAHCHFDGYLAYAVKCPHCLTIWQMPLNIFPREAVGAARENPKLLEPDEDYPVPVDGERS